MSTILMYHDIAPPPPPGDPHRGLCVPAGEFAAQLASLRAMGLRTCSAEEYDLRLEANRLGGSVWITFDDGRRNNYDEAFPLLRAEGMKATFFVIVDRSLSGDPEYLTVDQMREMLAAGMSIGCHSASHPRLSRCPPDQLRAEIHDSKKRLEDALGTAVMAFCHPYGDHNARVVEEVQSAGYRLAVSTIRDNRNTEADRFRLRRAMVQPGRTGWRFRYLFSGLYHLVHQHKNRKRWRQDCEGG